MVDAGSRKRVLPCVHCQHDLRAHQFDQRCPECGAPVIDTLAERDAARPSPYWRVRFAVLLAVLAVGFGLQALLLVGSADQIGRLLRAGALGRSLPFVQQVATDLHGGLVQVNVVVCLVATLIGLTTVPRLSARQQVLASRRVSWLIVLVIPGLFVPAAFLLFVSAGLAVTALRLTGILQHGRWFTAAAGLFVAALATFVTALVFTERNFDRLCQQPPVTPTLSATNGCMASWVAGLAAVVMGVLLIVGVASVFEPAKHREARS